MATATGRLVDNEGKPLPGYRIESNVNGRTVTTDENGAFQITNLISDHEIYLEIYAPGENEYRPYVPKLKTVGGQEMSLGDINVQAIETILVDGIVG